MSYGPHISQYPGECSLSKIMIKESVLTVSRTNIMSPTEQFSGFRNPSSYSDNFLFFDYVDNHATIFFSNESEFKPYKYIESSELILDPDVLTTKIISSFTLNKYEGSIITSAGENSSSNLYYGRVKPSSMNLLILPAAELSATNQDLFMSINTGSYNGTWYVYPNYQTGYIDIFVDFVTPNVPDDCPATLEYIEVITSSANNNDYIIICECIAVEYSNIYSKYIYNLAVTCLSSDNSPVNYHSLIFNPVVKYQTFKDTTYQPFSSTGEQLKFKIPYTLTRCAFPKTTLIATFAQIDAVKDIFLLNSGFENCPIYVYECSNDVITEEEYNLKTDTLVHSENIKYSGESVIYYDIGLTIDSLQIVHLLTDEIYYLEYDNVNKSFDVPTNADLGVYKLTLTCNKPDYFKELMTLIIDNEYTNNISLSNVNVLNKNKIVVIGDESNDAPLYMVPFEEKYTDNKITIFSDISRDVYPYIVDMRIPQTGIDTEVTVGNSMYDYIHIPLNHNTYISINDELTTEYIANRYNSVSDKYPISLFNFLNDNKNIWSKNYILDYYSINEALDFDVEHKIQDDLIILKVTINAPDDNYQIYVRNTNDDYLKAYTKLVEVDDGIYMSPTRDESMHGILLQQYNVFQFGYYPGFINFDELGQESKITIEMGYYDIYFNIYGAPTKFELSIWDVIDPETYAYGTYAESNYSGPLDED